LLRLLLLRDGALSADTGDAAWRLLRDPCVIALAEAQVVGAAICGDALWWKHRPSPLSTSKKPSVPCDETGSDLNLPLEATGFTQSIRSCSKRRDADRWEALAAGVILPWTATRFTHVDQQAQWHDGESPHAEVRAHPRQSPSWARSLDDLGYIERGARASKHEGFRAATLVLRGPARPWRSSRGNACDRVPGTSATVLAVKRFSMADCP
jgi:hypothetical protein